MLIEGGFLVHKAGETPLSSFQFTHVELFSFIVSFLTTILSYQVAAIVTDLFLGCKGRAHRGSAHLTDLGIMHFTEQGSMLAIGTAVFNSRFLNRLRYHGLRGRRGRCTSHPPDRPYVRKGCLEPRVAIKLFTLLLSVPFVNLIAIFLVLDFDRTISFGEARFGGLALDLLARAEAPRVNFTDLNADCIQYMTNFGKAEQPSADFYRCDNVNVISGSNENQNLTISSTISESGLVSNVFEIGEDRHTSVVSIVIRVDKTFYRLPARVKKETMEEQFIDAANFTANDERGCNNTREVATDLLAEGITIEDEPEKGTITLSVTVPCRSLSRSTTSKILRGMANVVDLQQTDTLQLLEVKGAEQDAQFSSGDRLPLFQRRRPILSLFGLILATGVALILRLLTRRLTYNDTDLGFEMIVKDSLGLKCFDSMLQDERKVDYWHGDAQEQESGPGEKWERDVETKSVP